MKNLRTLIAISLSAACALLIGCDSDSATSKVSISPSSVTVEKGNSIEFTASGGYEYTWSLAEDSAGASAYGILSNRTGQKTTYTSLRNASSDPVVRVLTVTSTIEGSDNTNSSPDEWTTQAYITHM